MEKYKVKQVILTWSEAQGLPGIGEFPKKFVSFEEANMMLRQIAEADRVFRQETGTYLGGTLKTGFYVVWEDGTEIDKGRIDVGYCNGYFLGTDLVEHIQIRAQWVLNTEPPIKGQAPWAKKFQEEFERAKTFYQELLKGYEL